VRFAEVMGLMGAKVDWAPYSITITGQAPAPLAAQLPTGHH
jgi:3-phosphoshikimate 1-carboxyvinyltransferase